MPINVIAVMKARDGKQGAVLDAIEEAATDFHADPGCRLYAPQRSGRSKVVLVESYDDKEALEKHASSETFARLQAKLEPLVDGPSDITLCTPAPAGDPAKGTL